MFKEVFVNFLQEKGITAYKVAKETGISQGQMNEYKNGKVTPTTENLIKIADYLECSIDFLLGRKEIYNKEQMELTKKEQELLDIFRQLNDLGQDCMIHNAKLTRQDVNYQKYTDISKEA